MAQGLHLDTNEKIGLLCSNSQPDLLPYKYKTYTPKLERGLILLQTQAQISFSGLHEKGRTNVRGNCCILLAEGNVCLAFAAFVTPHMVACWPLFSYSESEFMADSGSHHSTE